MPAWHRCEYDAAYGAGDAHPTLRMRVPGGGPRTGAISAPHAGGMRRAGSHGLHIAVQDEGARPFHEPLPAPACAGLEATASILPSRSRRLVALFETDMPTPNGMQAVKSRNRGRGSEPPYYQGRFFYDIAAEARKASPSKEN